MLRRMARWLVGMDALKTQAAIEIARELQAQAAHASRPRRNTAPVTLGATPMPKRKANRKITNDGRPVFNVAEVAADIGVSASTVCNWVHALRMVQPIQPIKHGRKTLFDAEGYMRWAKSSQGKAVIAKGLMMRETTASSGIQRRIKRGGRTPDHVINVVA